MYFHLVLEEINGEQSYTYDYLINANSMKEAEACADNKAEMFYDDSWVEKEGCWFRFFTDTIAVRVYSIKPTTKSEFIKHMLNKMEVKA